MRHPGIGDTSTTFHGSALTMRYWAIVDVPPNVTHIGAVFFVSFTCEARISMLGVGFFCVHVVLMLLSATMIANRELFKELLSTCGHVVGGVLPPCSVRSQARVLVWTETVTGCPVILYFRFGHSCKFSSLNTMVSVIASFCFI